MASSSQLPCDSEGACMLCKAKPAEEETLTCKTCATPWHVTCLSSKPETMAETLQWECPDCSALPSELLPVAASKPDAGDGSKDLVAKIRAIEADATLTEMEKARRRQQLMSGKALLEEDEEDEKETGQNEEKEVLDLISGSLNCSICMQLPERPVTASCGHNFCLKCFQKWIGQGKNTCAKCRRPIPPKMASQPRINLALVDAIRKAKLSKNRTGREPWKVNHFLHNQDRPDKAYTTERAQRNGKANAASGRIFVTVPQDHFGPIPAENDPVENRGVLVGDCWDDRLECRQWGAHFPHVSGIAGQSNYGAQSVVLSGGYVDDEDHGEWFLYTGSGGRDLSGNKRVNKTQSFDQKFEKYNMALQVSCLKGYPVRVVRSHKEKRSSYAPEKGLRYDGVYRIEKCWRKVGLQGFKVCRYLFVRCDNEPAPWTSDDHGDQPRPLPAIPELKKATDISERKESPSWDFDEKDSCWKWKKPPPRSQKPVKSMDSKELETVRRDIRKAQNTSIREKLLKEFSCLACKQVMASPVTTPCAHNFCKACLEGAFVGQTFVRDRNKGGRSLRCQKNVMKCPACPIDISDFLQNLQVNTELKDVIESLKAKAEENGKMADSSENANGLEEDCNEAEENGEMVGPSGNANGLEEDCNETSADEDAERDEDLGLKIELEQKHNGIPEAYDVSESKLEVANEKPDAAGKRNAKRKKVPAAEKLPRRGGSRKSEEDAEKDEDIDLEIELEQKHNAITEESDVGESKLEAANQKPDAAVKRNAKRKKAPAGEQLPRSAGSRKARRGRKSEEAVDGNDSPSSPLQDDNE